MSPVNYQIQLDAPETSRSRSDSEDDIQEPIGCDHTLLKCKSSYQFFSLSTETKMWYTDRNLRTPLRSKACRSKQKAEDQPQREDEPSTNQFDVLQALCNHSDSENRQPLEDKSHPETSLSADAIQTDDDDHGCPVRTRGRAHKELGLSPITDEHSTCEACNCTFSLLNETK